ncbi:methylamine utilization protein [Colwellia sp. 1_MG-2023]|uniref:methylamine utilization protein n=1 Tax=Colwellia sp. 1_MG-2023 TaxID=3062649 RepID=UPI0026E2DE67|nr:methylamine utilization protein [Colwellia sp. 1_MG-2023]MDO6445283.1 methylamine utilization protein [Colwellia sp. 1_MG-2023]
MMKISVALILILFAFKSYAVTITLFDQNQKPLSNAVVWLTPTNKVLMKAPSTDPFIMMQKDRQFIPHILVVPQNAQVEFPNADSIMHHVYSFSKSKTFELKLYREQPQTAITFDQTGVVELGCNIHDWMLSFIVVVDSPFYAITNENGNVSFNIEPDNYTLNIWHEGFTDFSQVESESIQITENNFSYSLKQAIKPIVAIDVDEFDDY